MSGNPDSPGSRHNTGTNKTSERVPGSHGNSSPPSTDSFKLKRKDDPRQMPTPGRGSRDSSNSSNSSTGKGTSALLRPSSHESPPFYTQSSRRSGDHSTIAPPNFQILKLSREAKVQEKLSGLPIRQQNPSGIPKSAGTHQSKNTNKNVMTWSTSTAAEQTMNAPQGRMLLARHLKQLTRSNTSISYYCMIIQKAGVPLVAGSDRHTQAVELLISKITSMARSCIFTDSQNHLVSTSNLPDTLTKECPIGTEGALVHLKLIHTVRWSNVLGLLHSANLPKTSQPSEAILNIFKVLLAQARELKKSGNKKEKPFTALEIQSYAADQHATQPQPNLAALMGTPDPSHLRSLETYFKGRSVRVGESDQARRRTIAGFARLEDTHDSNVSHPPKVAKYGGSSVEVSFFLKFKAKREAGATAIPARFRNRYITVADYFEQVKGQDIKGDVCRS